jgi:hypothetical protein
MHVGSQIASEVVNTNMQFEPRISFRRHHDADKRIRSERIHDSSDKISPIQLKVIIEQKYLLSQRVRYPNVSCVAWAVIMPIAVIRFFKELDLEIVSIEFAGKLSNQG